MVPAAGRISAPSGVVGAPGGRGAPRATGLENGFLKGRLGRTRLGKNVLSMAAPDNALEILLKQMVY